MKDTSEQQPSNLIKISTPSKYIAYITGTIASTTGFAATTNLMIVLQQEDNLTLYYSLGALASSSFVLFNGENIIDFLHECKQLHHQGKRINTSEILRTISATILGVSAGTALAIFNYTGTLQKFGSIASIITSIFTFLTVSCITTHGTKSYLDELFKTQNASASQQSQLIIHRKYKDPYTQTILIAISTLGSAALHFGQIYIIQNPLPKLSEKILASLSILAPTLLFSVKTYEQINPQETIENTLRKKQRTQNASNILIYLLSLILSGITALAMGSNNIIAIHDLACDNSKTPPYKDPSCYKVDFSAGLILQMIGTIIAFLVLSSVEKPLNIFVHQLKKCCSPTKPHTHSIEHLMNEDPEQISQNGLPTSSKLFQTYQQARNEIISDSEFIV